MFITTTLLNLSLVGGNLPNLDLKDRGLKNQVNPAATRRLKRTTTEFPIGISEAFLDARRFRESTQAKNTLMGTEQVVGAMVVKDPIILIKAILRSRPTIESGNPIKKNWIIKVIPRQARKLLIANDAGISNK